MTAPSGRSPAGGCRLGVLLAAIAVVFAAIWAVSIRPAHVTFVGRDLCLFWDGIHRVSLGQVPHVDFESPLGALNFWGPALFHARLESPFKSLPVYCFAMGLGLALVCALLMHRRGGTVGSLLSVVFVAALVAGLVELSSSRATHHGYYRRIGGATFLLVTILPFVGSAASSRRRAGLDGVLLAVLLYVAAFTKITYAVFDLALVLGAAVLWPALRRPAALALALLLAGVGLTEAAVPGFIASYGRNLLLVAKAHGPWNLEVAAEELSDWPTLLLALLPLLCLSLASGPRLERGARWRLLVFGAAVVVCWHLLDALDSPPRGWEGTAGLALGACAALELAERGAPGDRRARAALALALIATAALVVPRVVVTARGFEEHRRAAGRASNERRFDDRLVVPVRERRRARPADAAPQAGLEITRGEYLASGMELIAECGLSPASSRLYVFDLANPFSMLCGLQPPRNTKLYVHPDYNISTACKPQGRTLLGDVTDVLVPLFPMAPEMSAFLEREYGAYLAAEFREIGRNPNWVLHRRVVPGGIAGDILACDG